MKKTKQYIFDIQNKFVQELPIGPIEYGITYIIRPFMQFGNRLLTSYSKSIGDIQFPFKLKNKNTYFLQLTFK